MLHISAGRNGGWSPALTINKVCLSLMSMLASATELVRPHCWRLLRCLFVVHGLHIRRDFCGNSGRIQGEHCLRRHYGLQLSADPSVVLRLCGPTLVQKSQLLCDVCAEAPARGHGVLPQVAWALAQGDALGV